MKNSNIEVYKIHKRSITEKAEVYSLLQQTDKKINGTNCAADDVNVNVI